MTNEAQEKRLRAEAEDILERILKRRNWTVDLRDDLAAALGRIVRSEMARANQRMRHE